MVEVDKYGRTRIKCYDILQGKFVGETWMLDSYNPEEFTYTVDRFTNEDIFFAEGAEATLDSIVGNIATISFPVVPEESIAGRVYELQVYEKDGTLVSTQRVADTYYTDQFDRRKSVTLDNLVEGKEYKVLITALNPLYSVELNREQTLRSQPLEITFTLV